MYSPENIGPTPDASHQEDGHTEKDQIAELSGQLFVRELPSEYKELINNVKLIELREPYSENLNYKLRTKELQPLIQAKFTNEMVVDLGCGRGHWMMYLARDCGAAKYIGVDLRPDFMPQAVTVTHLSDKELEEEWDRILASRPKNDDMLAIKHPSNENTEAADNESSGPTIPKIIEDRGDYAAVKSDMLNFISRLPDQSIGAVIVSGIEELPVSPKEYMPALSREILRTLKPGGVIIKYSSDLFPEGEVFSKIATIEDRWGDEGGVFEKR